MNFGFFKIRLKNNGCLKIFILRIVGMDAINDQGMIIDGADRSVSFKSTFGSRQFFYPSGSLSNVPEEQMEQIWPMVTTERLAIPAKSGIVTHCKALHFLN